MILGIVDIEANYLVVKAYQYTTLPSVQVRLPIIFEGWSEFFLCDQLSYHCRSQPAIAYFLSDPWDGRVFGIKALICTLSFHMKDVMHKAAIEKTHSKA